MLVRAARIDRSDASRVLVSSVSVVAQFSRFDGATDHACRNDIKDRARIILTNPEMLHLSILQHHDPKWARLLGNLSYVIIDECHEIVLRSFSYHRLR